MGKIICFGDIHIHSTHKFSELTNDGYTIREQEHLSCATTICELIDKYTDCERVVFLGDMFGPVGDNISCQAMMVATEVISRIQNKCIEKNIPFDLIVGNHDVSSYLNNKYSHKLYPFKNYQNINVYDQPTVINNIVYMPYCNNDEFPTTFLENVQDKSNKIVFSHLELKFIDLGMGIVSNKGVDPNLLKQFKMTISGHYHSGTNYAKNIQVCGSTQRLSFKDKGIARRNILIYDTETNTTKRESFNCPDWLYFTDENIQDLLTVDNNNYVEVEVTFDKLITPKIENKLKQMKNYVLHTKLNRISLNNDIRQTQVESQDNFQVLKLFIDNSENSEEDKKILLNEGTRLLNSFSSI